MPVCAASKKPRFGEGGFSAGELVMVLVIIGILVVTATPLFIGYYQQGARLKLTAEEVAAFLNQGRQLGIRENNGVCVQITTTTMQYYVGSSCTGNAAATFTLPAAMSISASTSPITLNYLGAATPTTYTLSNAQNGKSLLVTLAISGRIAIKSP